MNKSLAVATLLGAVSANQVHELNAVDTKKMEQIVAGVLKGALHAEGFDDITTCVKDGYTILKTAEKAVTDFKRNSTDGTIDGLEDIASLLKDVKNSLSDCSSVKADWIKLENMVSIFQSPWSFAYHVGKDLLLNGVEIYGEITTAVTDYQTEAWGDFGFQVGAATSKVILGAERPVLDKKAIDAAKTYAIVKGILEGALEAEHLDNMEKCVVDSDAILLQAEKTYVDFSRPSLAGIKDGLQDIADLLGLVEDEMEDCKAVDADWAKVKNMVSIFKHPLSLAYQVGKDLMLNGVEIYGEVETAVNDYKTAQWEDFGLNVGKATSKTLFGMERRAMELLAQELENGNESSMESIGFLF